MIKNIPSKMANAYNHDEIEMFRKEFSTLKKNIEPTVFTDDFYQSGVFTYDEKREIDEIPSKVKRKDIFFDALHKHKEEGSFTLFWKVVEKKYEWLHKLVKEKLEKQVENHGFEKTSSNVQFETEQKHCMTLVFINMKNGWKLIENLTQENQVKLQVCVSRIEAAFHFILKILNFAILYNFKDISIDLELYFSYIHSSVFAGSNKMCSDKTTDRLTISLPCDSQVIKDIGTSDVKAMWIVRMKSNSFFGTGPNPIVDSTSTNDTKYEFGHSECDEESREPLFHKRSNQTKLSERSTKCDHNLVCSKCYAKFPNQDIKETEKNAKIKIKCSGTTFLNQSAYPKTRRSQEKSTQHHNLSLPIEKSTFQERKFSLNNLVGGKLRPSTSLQFHNTVKDKKRMLTPNDMHSHKMSPGTISPNSNSRRGSLEVSLINLYTQSIENIGVSRVDRSHTGIPRLSVRRRSIDLQLPCLQAQKLPMLTPSMRSRIPTSLPDHLKPKNRSRSQSSCC